MGNIKYFVRIGVVFGFLALHGNLVYGAPEKQSYNLLVALGFTGTGSTYSREALSAIRLAVDEINDKGGMLGKYPVKLFDIDTQTQPSIARQRVKELLGKQKIHAAISAYSSAVALALKPIFREHQVVHITSISNSEAITGDDFSPYTFSVVPSSYMQAKAVAVAVSRLADKSGWTRYATIASDYEWGRSTQANFVQLLKKQSPDIELVEEVWPSLGETRFIPYIAKLAKANPDFVYGSIASLDNLKWIQTASKAGFLEKFPYPGSLLSVTELIMHADHLPRGLIGLARAPFFAHPDVPAMNSFVAAYRNRFEQYPTDWAVMSYDAVHILEQGTRKAGTVDSDKLKDVMKGMEVATTRGVLVFRMSDNQLLCSSYVGVVSDVTDFAFPVLGELIEVKAEE